MPRVFEDQQGSQCGWSQASDRVDASEDVRKVTGQTPTGWVDSPEDFGSSAEGGGVRGRDVAGSLWLLEKNRPWGVRMEE